MAVAQIIVVRGPIAAGKTSVSEELAKRFERVAVIPVDWLRHMVGRWNPENKVEAVLAGRNAAALAQNFCDEGYQVIVDGPFDDLDALSALLHGLRDRQVQVVTLAASWNEILQRHETRPENQRTDLNRVRDVYRRVYAARGRTDGMWIETEGAVPADVAETILEGPSMQKPLPKQIPFYGAQNPEIFEIERRSMDRAGVVLQFLERTMPSGRVLDIGAGNGFTAERLSNERRTVVPCEPADGMIDRRKSFPWVRGLAQELPFRTHSFRAAYATWAYFFPKSGYGEEGLKEVNRVVSPGGSIIVVDNAGEDAFCNLFQQDISSDPAWWKEKGFDCHILETSFRFDSLEEARTLLSFYLRHNGRRPDCEVKMEIQFRVAAYTGRSTG